MKTSTLVDMLEMRGWSALDAVERKGARAALRALVLSLPFGSGEGYATVGQVALRAGYASRHYVADMLADLEGIGLVSWRRGGVYYGAPVPSYFRVNKQMLADLVNASLERCQERLERMRVEVRRRLARYRHVRYLAAKKRQRPPLDFLGKQGRSRFPQGTVTAHPSPLRGESRSGSHPRPVSSAPSGSRTRPAAARPAADASGGGRRPLPSDMLVVRVSRVEPMSNPPPAVAAARAAAAAAVAGCQERKRRAYERAVHPRVP